MTIAEMGRLHAGDVVYTTDGARVTFHGKQEVTRPRGEDRTQTIVTAVVEHGDGRRENIPPRSLHKGKVTR